MPESAFTWNVPERFNFARDVVDRLAAEDRLGLVAIDAGLNRTDFSFAQIADASKRWAAVLRDAGIGKGDRVVVVIPKIPEWLFCMTALLRIGAVAVPSAEQLRAKDLLYRATHSGAVGVVGHVTNADEIEVLRDDAPDLRAWLLVGGARPGWADADRLVDGDGAEDEVNARPRRGTAHRRSATTFPISSTPAARPKTPRASCTRSPTRLPSACKRRCGST